MHKVTVKSYKTLHFLYRGDRSLRQCWLSREDAEKAAKRMNEQQITLV